MMSTNNFRWSVTFVVKKKLTKEFREWMEKDHIPKIHATGFFDKGFRKLFEEKTDGEYDTVQYIHTPLNQDAWENYNNGPRSDLRKEFMDKWGGAVESKDLQMIAIVSYLELVEAAES